MSVVESPAGGAQEHNRRLRRVAAAILLASAAVPAQAGGATADSGADAAQPAPEAQQSQDIHVIGERLFGDIIPEADLDEDAIESYGVSTVDELLGEVQGELGEDEEPLILVNGELMNSLDEIGAFPVEALRNVRVLPRGSAVRAGGRTGQRVISLTLQRKMRAGTLTAAPKIAIEGEWHAFRGEALFTYLQGVTRANIGLRVRDESSLFESDRGIIQPEQRLPFALQGNVVGFPDTSGEIDPLLSALAGHTVTVARVPVSTSPTLADFAAGADEQNGTDIGQFRTLRPDLRNYDLNGTFYTRLAPWLTGNATLRLNRNESRSLRGLRSGLFVLSPTNASSPFSNDVGLTYFGQDQLRSRSLRESGDGRITLNGRFGLWTSNFNARHSESTDRFDTDRQSAIGMIPLDDNINPFATDLSNLLVINSDRTKSRTVSTLTHLSFTGPAFDLPAGPVQTTIEGRLSWYSLHAQSTLAVRPDRKFRRDEQAIRGAVDVPLTSRDGNVLAAIGNLGATAEYSRIHYSDAGSLDYYSLGLRWEPVAPLQLRGSFEQTERPPSMQILGNPVVVIPLVRVFDPQTGDTVDVTQIGGGNPDILPEKAKVFRLGALAHLVPRLNLQLNAEYTDTDARNYISTLPPASLPVMLAFPDRFIRDSDGNLVTVDFRPINFDSHREKRLRWGLSMRTKLRAGNVLGLAGEERATEPVSPSDTEAGEEAADRPQQPIRQGRAPSAYLQLSANHTVVFSDKLVIRPELDTVDLLGGGAIGIGGGRLRHQVDGTAAITSGGLGARVGVTWRGASTLDTSIGGISDTLHFSPALVANLRLFADARRFFPTAGWARGLRLSVDVVNVTNDRQRVRDSFGNTPLQYQPAYRDPLGRTIELEIRKVF